MLTTHKFGRTIAALLFLLALFCALPATAAVCTVTNINDIGPGSLRAAIGEGSCDSIIFALTYPATITLTTGELFINRPLSITGPGADGLTVDGRQQYRVLRVSGDATQVVEISGLTIQKGFSVAGGGIFLYAGTLNLTNSTVRWNYAGSAGGGIRVAAGATLNLTNSIVYGNNSNYRGGGVSSSGTLNLTNSTVGYNHAYTNYGGGIDVSGGTVNLTNSTVARNGSSDEGGIDVSGGTVNLKSTLLAGNDGGNCRGGPNGSFASLGHNLSDDGSCGLSGTEDMNSTSAGLAGVLQDNGGPTQTIALLPGSAAVDAIPPADCTDINGSRVRTDQRGAPRPLGDGCDIGAFELFIPVGIDIKPGTDPNSINPKSAGKIPVAICSSPDFDPQTVDPYSIQFSGAFVALKNKALTPMASYEYLSVGACSVDNTYPDLVLHFNTNDLTLTPGAGDVSLSGIVTTEPKTAILGTDSVRIVPSAR